MNYQFPTVIEKDDNGYFAFCPELQGCYTQGATYEEALRNIEDAIKLHLADRVASGELVPMKQFISFVTLNVSL